MKAKLQSLSFKERLAGNFPGAWAVGWRVFAIGLCLGAFPNSLIVDNQSASLVYIQLTSLALLLGLLGGGIYLGLTYSWEGFRRGVPGLKLFLEFLLLSLFLVAVFFPAQFGNFDGTEFMRSFTAEQVRSDWLRFGSGIALSIVITLLAWRFKFECGKFILAAAGLFIIYTAGAHFRDELSQTGFSDFRLLGQEKNIVVLIMDALQGTFVDIGFQEDKQLQEIYRDFTFYRRAVSPGSCTLWALPGILHGEEIYAQPKTIPAMRDVVVKDSLFDDLKAKGINYNYLTTCWTRFFHPSNQLVVSLPIGYYKIALQLAATRILPLRVAKAYLNKTQNEAKKLNAKLMIRDFTEQLTARIDFSADKTRFLLYHSLLTHSPVILDRTGNLLPNDVPYNAKLNREENVFALAQLGRFLDKLKEKGVYDSSLIVIMADHGGTMPLEYELRHLFTEQKGVAAPRPLSVYNPAILIKPPYQTDEFTVSDAPFANCDLRKLVRFYLDTDDWRQRPQDILAPPADRVVPVFVPLKKPANASPDLPDLTKVVAPDIFAALKKVCDDPSQAAVYPALPLDQAGLKLPDYWLGYMLYGSTQGQTMLLKSPAYLCFTLEEKKTQDLFLQLQLSPLVMLANREAMQFKVLAGEQEVGAFRAERKGTYQVRIPANMLRNGKNILLLRAENPILSSKLGLNNLRYEEKVSSWLGDFQLSTRPEGGILADDVPLLSGLVKKERIPDYCYGFWHHARKGSWLTGEGGELRFAVQALPEGDLHLRLRVTALVTKDISRQLVKVFLGDKALADIDISDGEGLIELAIPQEAFSPEKTVQITFVPENPINPVQAQLPYWAYNGKLSFCLQEMRVLEPK